MFNVLIADDEYFIRQRLKKIIEWQSLNLNFIGEAENGEDVIRFITENQVDILLLDIMMPLLSGLKVAEYIKDQQLDIRIIILTGYNDFDFAQKAIKLKVEDYLVKPINKDHLNQALDLCKTNLLEDRKSQEQLRHYNSYLKRTELYNVIADYSTTDALLLQHPDLAVYDYMMFLGVYTYGLHEPNLNLVLEGLNSTLRLQSDCDFFIEAYREYDSISMIQILTTSSDTEALILDVCHAITRRIASDGSVIYISLSSTIDISAHWPTYYNASLQHLNQRYFSPDHHVLILEANPPVVADPVSIRKKLILSLNAKDTDGANSLINTLFDTFMVVGTSDYLFFALTEIFVTLKINSPQFFKTKKSINGLIQELVAEHYALDDLKAFLMLSIFQCMDDVTHDKPSNTQLINKVIAYINEHYTSTGLSTAEISAHFDLTSTYLGTIFKKITHQSLLQYITELRMEKAKILLKSTDHNVTEIASMVGYADVFYFSKKFKLLHGCSPKNYIK